MTDATRRTPKRVAVVGLPGKWSSEALADALAERTGFRLIIDLAQVSVDLNTRSAHYAGVELTELDALVVKKVDAEYSPHMLDRIELLRFIERCGVRVFSKSESILRLVDRLSCTVTLAAAGIPMPHTRITEDVEQAARTVNEFGGAVLKPLYSTKARGMLALEPGELPPLVAQIQAFKDAGNPVMYVQKRVNLPDRDLGIVFMGGEYMTTYARVRNQDSWNTTTQDGGHYAAHEPRPELIDLARRAQALFDLDFTAVDVVDTVDEGPLVFEVSAFGGFRGLRDANQIDAAARYADYVLRCLEK